MIAAKQLTNKETHTHRTGDRFLLFAISIGKRMAIHIRKYKQRQPNKIAAKIEKSSATYITNINSKCKNSAVP
jgi:hypothetical protein